MAFVKTTSTGKPVELGGLAEESFELDLSSTDTLISLLANMYARPEFSSLREVLQNAKDAGPGKIRVSLPTEANPTLVVQDSGGGMREADMREYLKKVGASDKRGKVDMAGNLGIGSIAPMSVADNMTISSVKDGMLTVLTAWKNDAGDIKLAIAPEVPSGEPQGTKVCVPLHPELFERFRQGLDVFRFSPKLAARIVVDGAPLVPYAASIRKTVKVGEHEVSFSLVDGKTSVLPGALVLMNDVPMGASLERFPELKDFAGFLESHDASLGKRSAYSSATTMVIDIPPEAGLSFPPSREVIAVTRLNASFLSNACKRFFASGVEELEKNGVAIGSESAVLTYWRNAAMQAGKTLREVQNKVTHELNKTSKYLRASLSFSYWQSREIPVVAIEPKLPSDTGARILSAEKVRLTRRADYTWRLQTCGLVPMDVDKPELGLKLPFASTSAIRIIEWSEIGKEGSSDWSVVLSQNLKAKQALFELATETHAYYGLHERQVLVLLKPLPDDHPLMKAGNVERIDFGEYLEDFAPRADNPYVFEEEDEETDEETGDKKVRIKQRHPRRFIGAKGEREQLGLPLERPFVYLETMRGHFTASNDSTLPRRAGHWSTADDYRSWMSFFEGAGIGDGYDAVCLIPSEAAHIRRPHVLLQDALSAAMQAYLDGLEKEERAWIPFALYRGMLGRECPGMLKYFDAMAKRAPKKGKRHPALAAFLAISSKPPSDKMALFQMAWKEACEKKTNVYAQFAPWLDSDLSGRPAQGAAVFGFPAIVLTSPLRLLRAWMKTDCPLVRWTRLFWSLHHENGHPTYAGGSDWLGVGKGGAEDVVKPADAAAIAAQLE